MSHSYDRSDNSSHDISVGSLNVRGINNDAKRKSVFNWAKKHKFDVTFMQETFSSQEIENSWKSEWSGPILYSHGTKHGKGTMILFKPDFDFEIITENVDLNGRFIIVKIKVEGLILVLINIYAPNKENEKKGFFSNLSNILQTMNITENDCIISGGDWNSIFNDQVDKCGGRTDIGNNVVTEMKSMIDTLDLYDIWRIRNFNIKRFTYRQKTPLIQSRLDYFLISHPCLDIVSGTDIVSSVWFRCYNKLAV